MKVLVVEDDTGLADTLSRVLTSHQYQVELATDGEAGLSLVEIFDYDLVLLDLHLPKLNGIHFCQKLRLAGGDMPILLMTAEEAIASKIAGLDAGADDYVTKPLDTGELLARIRALLRRGRVDTSPTLTWGPLSLDPGNYEVRCHDQQILLTGKEYGILELFLRNQHRIFSLDTLIERLWSFEKMPSENAVRTHIKSLRRKLKTGGVPDSIETVYGLGYRLREEPTELAVEDTEKATDVEEVTGTQKATAVDTPCAVPADASSDSQTDQLDQQDILTEIWTRHQQKYLKLISHIEQVVPTLTQEGNAPRASVTASTATIERSRQAIHTLKGALGSFGFMASSKIAAKIEPLLLAAPHLNASQCCQLAQLIQSLRHSLTATAASSLTSPLSQEAVATQPTTDSATPQWLIIDSDQTLVEDLTHKASVQGIQTRIATTLPEARQAIAQQLPSAVMIDPRCDQTLAAGLAFLRSLTLQHPDLPIIVATAQDTLSDRLKILRSSGSSTFLHKPTSADHILEHVQQSLMSLATDSIKILALDDDPQILQCLQTALAPCGFQLTLVSDPIQFWQTIEQSAPDLLILDIEMPELSGIELCQIIRSDPRLSQIPILFLSAHTDTETVTQVFGAGADDYISKPIVASELVGRISNRLERLRRLRTLAETDSLTGLISRHSSVVALNRLLTLATRQETTLCLAVLDLDNFKQVNDRYGHDVGDRVLKTFGTYLKRAFRGEDVTARWGGEEFVIGFYDSSQTAAVRRLNDFLARFNQHTFTAENIISKETAEIPTKENSTKEDLTKENSTKEDLTKENSTKENSTKEKKKQSFQVSFSAGIATYPHHGKDIQTLHRKADLALYQAKSTGRRQVTTAAS